MGSDVQIGFSLKNVSAREVMEFSKSIKNAPDESVLLFAGLMAKTIVSAPIEGDLSDPETYLSLPFWSDGETLSYNDLVEALNEALEKAQSGTKKQ